MAKIKTLGDAVVVVSTLKFEDIKFLEKYRKDALALKGGEDNKEIIFRVGASGTPSANEYGITFEGATRDEAKQAILTLSLNYEGEDIKGFIADQLGSTITQLEKLENTVPTILAEVKAEREAIVSSIEIA